MKVPFIDVDIELMEVYFILLITKWEKGIGASIYLKHYFCVRNRI